MKVLSIGNSFSEDAHAYLHKIALASGEELDTLNLMIGGCSLERHYNNMLSGEAAYGIEINGGAIDGHISLSDALKRERWDVVTLQQVSGSSGRPQSYFPYLGELYDFVRKNLPDAKIYFHQTWAYETDSAHAAFDAYSKSQDEMYRRICDTAEMVSRLLGIELIPVGPTIQTLRDTLPEFDYKNGGRSLCRDGFHLSLDYGRFTAAAVWFHTLTGKRINTDAFDTLDRDLLERIVSIIEK